MKSVDLDEIYTNLSLIDKSNMKKTPITHEDLLTNVESTTLSKRILIEGEAGVGKTTLCSKVAWDWCQGRILHDLDMVIVIPLREVTDGKSIGDIVVDYLCDSNTATPDQIDDYVLRYPENVLLVFDGFDEFDGNIKESSNSVVIRILALERYKSCNVIVTTRPWKSHDFKMKKELAKAYTFISAEGFDEDNFKIYIKRYFQNRPKDILADSLIGFLEENDIIRTNMAPFPIYCAMLCLMWEDFSEERRKELTKLQTFSEIFGEMISFLKEHYASKVCGDLENPEVADHLTEAGKAIQHIGKIALNGLFDKTLSFPEKHFKECHDTMETCCRVGVLTIEKDVTRRKGRRDVNRPSLVESVVSFPHKLFQEYVAGVYIANVYVNDHAEYNQLKQTLLSEYEEFRYLLYFASA
ncbi:NACHT, LRR and PYD domains-containing protein 3-like, partial [Diadema antillarum]|uniref:NACHT, LRR and PYD domains-containing protein 3-like n=1 Tax=Diadema antillarum TaxID=105358 RepID=UPI003A8C5694